MTKNKRMYTPLTLLLFTIGAFILIGCGANETVTSSSQASANSVGTNESFHASDGTTPLSLRVKGSKDIVIAKITSIGSLVWTTPDGKEPANMMDRNYNYIFEQLAPIEITVVTNLKGDWEVGKKVTVLVAGAPSSKPYGNSWEFPKVDEVTLWFLGPEADYRRGTSNQPLLTPNLTGLYKQLPNGTWYNTSDKAEVIDLSIVKQTIQNPLPVATQIPASSTTSNVQPGQVLNLVQYYNLNNSNQIILKGGPNPRGITDKNIIQTVLNALDKSQTVSNDTSLPGSEEKDKHVALIFIKPDNSSLGLDYNFKDNYLIVHSTDTFRIPVTPELRQVLNLN